MTTSKIKLTDKSTLICQKQVQHITGLNISEIKALMQHGLFPQSIQIIKRLLWSEAEINYWIQKFHNTNFLLDSDLLLKFNFLSQQFNEASALASLASRNLIYYGKKVKPRLKKQMDDLKEQLQPKLI